jgi:hypothetical protein
VPGALFVADQDVADLLGVEQRVIGGEHGPARNAEDHVYADALKGEHESLRPGDLDRGRVVRPPGGLLGAARLGEAGRLRARAGLRRTAGLR